MRSDLAPPDLSCDSWRSDAVDFRSAIDGQIACYIEGKEAQAEQRIGRDDGFVGRSSRECGKRKEKSKVNVTLVCF